eukprot:TRINITY_DN24525_c0_g1_i2.p1 TRINITY_DN24525_c0_g1~~TRINITY_DN24525_c0_g1_i2.p1  ORF type:complete len:684 (+),score=155.84 TRINITY_DN24525_c0_g1_i2:41-2092(+)
MSASPHRGGTENLLPQERQGASFQAEALDVILHGKAGAVAARSDPFLELFAHAPFNDADMDAFRSYEEKWCKTMERTSTAIEVIRNNPKLMMSHMAQRVSMRELFPTGSLGIHFSMFLTFIRTQASDEQQKKWLGPAQEGRFFGAYAQTELGHGSNLRGLETTATYDKGTQEFIIHSPTLTSMKWWPTGMYCCTHAAVMANLFIDGENLGFHGFMVQLRDEEGRVLPGIEIGEIGPKINADLTNIGYARFTGLRIPLFNMFARAQQVTPDGKYIKPASKAVSKFKYISMMNIRVDFVHGSFDVLSRASTIAIRYSCVRKQGYKRNDQPELGENVVLDYQMQQYRLFKALSLSYMFYWNARYIRDYLVRIQKGMMDGDEKAAEELPELHATLSGFKVFATVTTQRNLEECRLACGGQGFLRSSGVGDLPQNFNELVTAEGEQVILSQQLSRFLIKEIRRSRSGAAATGMASYLSGTFAGGVDFKEPTHLLALLEDRARRFALKLEANFTAVEAAAPGCTFEQALNACAVLAWRAAEAHTMYAFAANNLYSLRDYVKDPTISTVLHRLWQLMALQQISENGAQFAGLLSEQDFDLISERIVQLLGDIRPDAVVLVDSFGYQDRHLKSTLGRFDGNVYEAIYEEAKKSPLNQSEVMLGWSDLAKILDLQMLRDSRGMMPMAAASKL